MIERVPDWEKRLNEVIEKHMALPSEYGVSDCYLIPADAFEAITGEKLYPGVRYKTEAGAGKQLRKRGFETVEDAFRARLPEIGRLMAQRGDLGVVERDGVISGGVFTSIGFATRGERSLEFLPATEVKTAFQVGDR
ncbi:hypothetical protein H7H48_02180 [Nitratireductor sp. B36]|uniref:DUF6950 family protein n=1 Tax=Nitratireductor sp. B36 TaxID=2762059 RepID=UPI001E2F45BB|nr:hypothetical protein [Nitratireductor sp. B36]MCC5777844.1 hypothetical protein [Nitratireductor sp. B36]